MAYKEVNFKSKLIEWAQKNRVKMDFREVSTNRDDNGSPSFIYRVVIEGVECCEAKGYSKKEAQQLASRDTLQRLRREPQLIDAIFTAKSERTKMEEEPTAIAPDITADIAAAEAQAKATGTTPQEPKDGKDGETRKRKPAKSKEAETNGQKEQQGDEEFDLSDITATPKELSREEIIAAAEAEAFAS